MKITLITGGVRSGKSSMAERLAAVHEQVAFIATCQNLDEEMHGRIEKHKLHRPQHWVTIEEPLNLIKAITNIDSGYCILLDCLGLWVTNCLLSDENSNLSNPDAFISLMERKTLELLHALRQRQGPAVIVTNEVGLGLVPPYKLGRVFRDCLGRINTICANQADDVFLCATGLPLCLKRNGMVLHG